MSNYDAAEHAGCIRGLCRAGNHHQAVRCDEPAAQQPTDGGALDYEDRLSLAECIRIAFDTPPDERVIQDSWLYAAAMAEQWYVGRAARSQRPEGVTVTEAALVEVQARLEAAAFPQPRHVDLRPDNGYLSMTTARHILREVRAQFAAEVSGDTEAGGDQ